ncbi:hypothetical protein G7043_39845 [Lentzea sp. NEAU-D13]|uniref:Phage integrase family protein n=1 Tax=Lentzea alba TaxID=2714351 RepID=A0A7C9RX67_9PSEU|nr:hypothetical protein [Lentzea alba]NGY65084.1 hypothetical protein [Lentzea alba]
MTSLAAWTSPDRPELPGGQQWVLAGRPLRPDVELAYTSRFMDEVWRLDPGVLQRHVKTLALDFPTIPGRYRLHAKQLCYAMLAGPLPPGEKRQSLFSIRSAFIDVRRFLSWLDNRPAVAGHPLRPDLARLTTDDLADYHRHLLTLPNASASEHARRVVRLFWRYRTGLADPLSIDPHQVESWSRPKRPAENTTDRIPEPVLWPLLGWALRFVDEFAPDILDAHQRWLDYRSRFRNGKRGHNPGAAAQLQSYLDDHVHAGYPLPGYQGRPNLQFIAAEVGISHTGLIRRHSVTVNATAALVGVTEYTWLGTAIRGRLDGAPWINDIAVNHPAQSVRKLARLLQVSCWVVIAFLSGMRDSEVKHLRRGCVTVARDAEGRPYWWKLTSRAFKGETDAAGTEATWIVGHPAARAVAVLEQLQPVDRTLLFSYLAHSNAAGSSKAIPDQAQSTGVTNAQLGELVRWINDYCALHGHADGIPLVNGRSWRLSTRQFRRTLAWFIARRPGGVIAGAIQYRHLSVQMFEGYAGTSDSGFRAEVESEQALSRGEHLLTMIDAHEHTTLIGPAAEEARRRLDGFAGRARFTGTVMTDSHRLARLLRRDDPAIYPGTFATCVFNHDKALCRSHRDTTTTPRPVLGDCRPLECANVALTATNTSALRTELDHVDHELAARPSLPPLLTHRLRSRRDQIQQFLDRHLPEPS